MRKEGPTTSLRYARENNLCVGDPITDGQLIAENRQLETANKSDRAAWVVGTVLALAAGYVHLVVSDPTFTALLVTMVAMGLGLARPERPWRWAVLCSITVPLVQFVSYLKGERVMRGQWEGAFVIGLASGIAGAFLGSLFRRVYRNISGTTHDPAEPAAKHKK